MIHPRSHRENRGKMIDHFSSYQPHFHIFVRKPKIILDTGINSILYTSIMEENFKHLPFWLAGELAAAAGVSTDTLRHYERKGVLPKPNRASNGYRRYPANALERVRLIRNALAVGFTLDELSRFLSERDQGGAPCGAVRALAA